MRNSSLSALFSPSLIVLLALLLAMPVDSIATPADSVASPVAVVAQNEEPAADSTHVREFRIVSFKQLANDISAFVNPVYDLNAEACALLKVVGPEELAFSTPLGIVERRNEVGEIWLFLPHGSKRITVKHPEHGVIRDFRFGHSLESRMTYELTLNIPQGATVLQRDTVVLTKTITETIRDTVMFKRVKPAVPRRYMVAAGVQMNRYYTTKTLFLATMKRHGVFLHGGSLLTTVGETRFDCDETGMIGGFESMPYYTDEKRKSGGFITAGLIHRLSDRLRMFEGAGYARYTTAWQLADSEGGGYARNEHLSHSGVALELGAIYSINRVDISIWGMNTAFKEWHAGVGIGINLGRRR